MAYSNADSPANHLPGSIRGKTIKYEKRSYGCKRVQPAFEEGHCCWGFLQLMKAGPIRVIEYKEMAKRLSSTAWAAGCFQLPFVLNRLLKTCVHPCSSHYPFRCFFPSHIYRRFWIYCAQAPNRPACPCSNACVSLHRKKCPDTIRLIWLWWTFSCCSYRKNITILLVILT